MKKNKTSQHICPFCLFSNNSPLKVKVSMFESRLRQVPTKSICLGCWLSKPHPRYSGLVEEIRACEDKAKRPELKGRLPVIMPAGVFKDRYVLEEYSGLACIDIDGKDNQHIQDWNKVKHMMRSLLYVAYAGLSCGGNGLIVLVRIEKFENQKTDIFPIIHDDFKQFDIAVDVSKKGGSDLRYYSIDPSPYVNDKAICIEPPRKLVLPKVNETQKPQFNAVDTTGNLKRFIETYLQTKSSEFDHDDWIRLGMGLVYEFKEDGRHYFHELSKPDSRYDYKECDRLYTDLMKRGYQKVTGGTIRMLLS